MGEVRWIYNSGIGELEVWAKTKEDAAFTLKQYGITKINLSDIKLVPDSPQDFTGGEID